MRVFDDDCDRQLEVALALRCERSLESLRRRLSKALASGRGGRGARAYIVSRAHILVVDDDPHILHLIDRVLGSDHDLVLVDGGDAALALLRRGPKYDLVLCDLSMPKIGGAQVYTEVAAVRPEMAKRFVFLHGGATTDRDSALLERVDRPSLLKPFTVANLRFVVDGMLASRD